MTDGLPHGWLVDDLTVIARHVARTQRGLILDEDEARDVAAVALIERLYAAPAPSRLDLFRAARHALGAANAQEVSHRGLDRNAARSGREGTPRRFAAYWHGRGALVSPFEEGLVEHVAVEQVWRALRPRDQETLATLAAHGDYAAAAAVLDVSINSWRRRLNVARARARELWYAPEPAAPQWGTDRPGCSRDPRGRNKGLMHVARRRRKLRTEGDQSARP
ncbi:MAG: hypothetical protein JWO67_2890 [Streptosporangiaceae bacterium]|nr:hypothetical protein [Streptosporangiaceae bacterium]